MASVAGNVNVLMKTKINISRVFSAEKINGNSAKQLLWVVLLSVMQILKKMGLDVRTYGNIKLSENEEDADFIAYVIDDNWKHKIKNLQEGKVYTGEEVYRGVSYPYSAHNRFREKLIKLIDRIDLLDSEGKIKWSDLPKDIPFNDFIDFADNEGCLDWEISEKIYADFEKYDEKAKSEMNDFDYSRYEEWKETFYYGKDRGVVVFS